MSTKNPRILCVIDYFLPGFLAGGPITTISNLTKQLAGKIDFSIVTRNHDLGSEIPFPNIKTNEWNITSAGNIFYASPFFSNIKKLAHSIENGNYDVIYLNSFFSPSASIILYLSILRSIPSARVLIAPRGEFSSGALSIKKHKKKIFLLFAKRLKLYKKVFWHASSRMEANDIVQLFPDSSNRIYIAPDPVLPPPSDLFNHINKKKVAGHLRIVFISRISPMKNLDGLLRILSTVQGTVEFHIFGPVENNNYWEGCSKIIATLPKYIRTQYHGPIHPELVSSTFADFDLFVFPTLGENFGHVIFESLRAGTPVLLSDQTPWQPDATDALTVIPLHDMTAWADSINKATLRTAEEQVEVRLAAAHYAKHYADEVDSEKKNLDMFMRILNS